MNKYSLSTILAGVLWGIISIFLKTLTSAGLSALQVMFVRASLSAFLMLLFMIIKDKSLLKIQFKDIWMFIGTGVISLTFFTICYFTTILEVGTSIAVILLYTSPIFILIMSLFLFGEKLTARKLIALTATFAGCILVSGIAGGGEISLKGFFIGICAGFGYALYSIFSRYALKTYNSLTVTFYTFVFSSISLIPFTKITTLPILFTPKITFFTLGIAFFCTVLPYILYTFGLTGLETGKAAILVTVEPLVGTLTGIFLWKEEITFIKLCGIILIFLAVILLGKKEKL